MSYVDANAVSPAADEERAVATITTAFAGDPVVRWVWPDPNQYLRTWPAFVRAFAGGAFPSGTADAVADYRGVAMWLPPGRAPDDDAVDELVTGSVALADHDDVFALFEQMGEFHPTEAHWYLPLIGVDVTSHGRGFGTALLQHALARCDQENLPAYLEATSPRNRLLYAAHGFEEIGVIQASSSPLMWPMMRKPGKNS